MRSHDLIVAPATPAGKGAVGIVRLSGSGVQGVVDGVVGKPLKPRMATLCGFREADGSLIDRGLALYFPPGHSYTGEEMLELQGHGGPIVQQLLLRRCLELGARLAEPGEFTQRAFLNDRLDLAQAEAVADLIEAQSDLAARSAVRSLQGEFSARVTRCAEQIIELRALTESSMDFPEEGLELVPDSVLSTHHEELLAALDVLIDVARQGQRLREGVTVVIAGRPNVGKSSLLNRLVEEDVAIVSDVPGTTRDVVRDRMVIEGLAIELLDTAGLRDTDDPLERLGIDRTRKALETAQLTLHVVESDDSSVNEECLGGGTVVKVVNKIDARGEVPRIVRTDERCTVYLSALTGAGMDLLRRAMLETLGWFLTEEGKLLARERHLTALQSAKMSLTKAGVILKERELFAEELRLAQQALLTITGEFTSDDLLGLIFSRFCIGK